MLRIAGAKSKNAVIPTDDPENVPTEPVPDVGLTDTQDASPDMSEPSTEGAGGIIDPIVAGYRQPDQGPFMCGNCVYFTQGEPGSCEIVSGPIDEMGMCNVFTPNSQHGQETDHAEGEPPPVADQPVEEPPVA